MTCKHKFARLNDSTIFCERCGETRVVAAPVWPGYSPIVIYPVIYPSVPSWPYYSGTWSGTLAVSDHT